MKLRYALVVLIAVFGTVGVQAQDKTDAINLFNKALEDAKAKDYETAINGFLQAISVADQIGAEGADVKQRSEKQIPGLYFQVALTKARKFQKSKTIADLDDAIASLNEAEMNGKDYGDSEVERRASGLITQMYFNKSSILYNQGNFPEATSAVNTAIERNGNYSKAFYHRALISKKSNPENLDAYLSAIDEAIVVAERINDSRVARTAKKAAHDELLFRGSTASQEQKYSTAIPLLNRALDYDAESAGAFYRLAEAYNKQEKYDDAISNANKALQFEKGGRGEKAKIYFEIGYANQYKNNKEAACSAYTNAAFGSFKEAAEHSMEFELKCKETK